MIPGHCAGQLTSLTPPKFVQPSPTYSRKYHIHIISLLYNYNYVYIIRFRFDGFLFLHKTFIIFLVSTLEMSYFVVGGDGDEDDSCIQWQQGRYFKPGVACWTVLHAVFHSGWVSSNAGQRCCRTPGLLTFDLCTQDWFHKKIGILQVNLILYQVNCQLKIVRTLFLRWPVFSLTRTGENGALRRLRRMLSDLNIKQINSISFFNHKQFFKTNVQIKTVL